jgi:hypothetical protein
MPQPIVVGATGAGAPFSFFMPDASNPIVGVTGIEWVTADVVIRLPDGVGFVNADVSRIVEIGFGIYEYRLNAAETDVAGRFYLKATKAGAQDFSGFEDIILGASSGETPTVPTSCRSVTLAELRAKVLLREGIEGSDDITATVLDDIINGSLVELWDLMKAKDDDRLVTSTTLATVAGTATVVMPCMFYELRKLEIVDPSVRSGYRQLYQGSLDAQHRYSTTTNKHYRYRIQGSSLVLMPTPQAVESLRLYYIPFAPILVAPTDAIDGYNGYEELILALARKGVKERQELDTSGVEREIARLTARIMAASNGRDVEPFYLSPLGAHNYDHELEDLI